MKKRISLFLVLVFIVCIVVSCAKTDEDAPVETGKEDAQILPDESADDGKIKISEKGVLPIVDKPIEIEVFMAKSAQVEDYDENKYTKFLEENTNIRVKWVLVPVEDRDQRLNVMLASNEPLPDVIMGGMSNQLLVEYGGQGVFLPLNEYIEKQSINFIKLLDEYEELEMMITAPDGNIYALPNITMSIPNSYPFRMWINKVWLDNIGAQIPDTTEEFRSVLRDFKTKDPNQNGKDDDIPLVGSTGGWHTDGHAFFINSFIQCNTNDMYLIIDGKFEPVYLKEEYRNALRYLNSLVEEGLYDPISFTQDADQLRALVENEEACLVGCMPGGMPTANIGGERIKEFVALPPLEGPDGVRLSVHEPCNYLLYPNVFVITKDCEYPEAVFKWADYMYDEEVSMRSRLGEPGVDWVEAEEGEVDLAGNPALYKAILLWGTVHSSHWYNLNPTHENFADRCVRSDDPYELQRLLWEATYNCYIPYTPEDLSAYPPRQMLYTLEDSKKLNEINTVLRDYIKECRDKFILGVMDIESDWDEYVNNLKSIGYEEVISIMQKRYDELTK
ncbi:MAG: extracellular solute-binding protein [Clostridiales bacterium]|jgi:putative aldouronate transport system substrate-binding protein|nr:extracellular solute-binding protein [Clostridiales bacterium]